MKKTLKTILQNSIDEKKYIFKYPITTFKYYDNANFLLVDNIEEDINQIAENKDMEEDYNQNICDYNVERDIERYLEEYNDENIANNYTKKIYILGGLCQKDKKEIYSELKKIREFAKKVGVKEIALELPVKYVLENSIRELKKYGVKEIILSAISLDDEILEKNGLNYGYKEITKAVFKIALSFMKMSLSLIIGLSNDEKEELRSVYKAKELKPKTIIFMQNIVLKGTENAKKFVRGNLKMLSVEENKNLLEKATKMVLEKKILDIIYIKSIQENRIKDKYLTGVIYNNIEEEIITRMYYNYLFEKIKKLKVRNEYITIKANDSILKYIKGKEDHNLNKIKELYYIREIKILKENKGVNKNINKLEIIIENNERD
ncbi:MAG: radical SAM protein [Clostridiales bacterium]|nr:radical SAM protein [Clostridiales bacterium]